ncbi:hypothetical protein THAOC_09418 [Thalassiosira oceanica]|uniref:B30.2/SPRY domain-containing protein n=1 Tax=Thalassiosira oceanica TaxID=159749 RepID=K0SWJ1_THAOC|nr:hypothetical protein THAOC_09418 [Thalassiosira oceanica]|eukprot:EJK69334.1 hypothetical protein THAOC_09418 [Thalassiosira oceanica]
MISSGVAAVATLCVTLSATTHAATHGDDDEPTSRRQQYIPPDIVSTTARTGKPQPESNAARGPGQRPARKMRLVSRRGRSGAARAGGRSVRNPQAGRQRSLANEAARLRFRRSATDEERRCLPKHGDESDICLYRALEQLREPLSFDELAGHGFSPQENPAQVTHAGLGGWSTAVSGNVMRGGRHFVEFVITKVGDLALVNLGVIRPVSLTNDINMEADWGGSVNPVYVSSHSKPAVSGKLRSQGTASWGDSDIHCCSYESYDGRCGGTDWDTNVTYSEWHGREGFDGSGTIGLLLDLGECTLSVFKNYRRLGVMKEGGLSGEYCWFVSVYTSCAVSISRNTNVTATSNCQPTRQRQLRTVNQRGALAPKRGASVSTVNPLQQAASAEPEVFLLYEGGGLAEELRRSLTHVCVGPHVIEIPHSAFSDCDDLIELHLNVGLQVIGERAFDGCKSLRSVCVPLSVTELGKGAFYECSGLVELKLKEGLQVIHDFAFAYCAELRSVTLPSSVTELEEFAFNSCRKLFQMIPQFC